MKTIKSAGGVIFNEKNEVLFIHRRGYWDLPKGKIEKGEAPLDAACREVAEETGLTEYNVMAHSIGSTEHIYFIDDVAFKKKTIWFEFHSNQGVLKMQESEGIDSFKWAKLKDVISGKALGGGIYENILNFIKTITR